jgi:two-component sensor histidine kinase
MDDTLERKKARLAESRARIDAMVEAHEEASAQRLADVIDTAMGDSETMSVEEFRQRLAETE